MLFGHYLTDMGKDSKYYQDIITRLNALFKKQQLIKAGIGAQKVFIILFGLFTLITLAELVSYFSVTVKSFLLIFLIFSVLLLISSFILKPLLTAAGFWGSKNHEALADLVGQKFPAISDDLKNAIQLVENGNNSNYSSSLTYAALKFIYDKSQILDFSSVVDFRRVKDLLVYSGGVLLVCALLFLFIPGLQAATFRLINYDQQFLPPQKFYFNVSPGDVELTKGESLTIKISTKGYKPGEILFAQKYEEQTDYSFIKLVPDSTGVFTFITNPVYSSFVYFAEAEDIKSDEFRVKVTDRPIIRMIDFEIIPPGYSNIPKIVQKDNGNISALAGSVVNINLISNKELKEARIVFSDTSNIKMNINSNSAEGKFQIRKDVDYRIIITDLNGKENLSPITYSVKMLNDAYPVIEVVSPNSDVSLATDNRLAVLLKINDDYGFSNLLIKYRLSFSKYEAVQNEYKSIEIPISKSEKAIDVSYIWNLTSMSLAVEDVVTYYFEVFDNDYYRGPKSSRTIEYSIRVPSLDEILTRTDEKHEQAENELNETLKKAEELQKTLEKIDRDLKQDKKEITWEEKQKIEKALEEFESLQNKVDDIAKNIQDLKQELQQNNLLSKETIEKYLELQELMSEMTSDEMKKMMDKMREMLQKMDRQMTQDALENFKLDEERIKKSIERTLNLLKRIQIEQKVDDLLKRLEQLEKNLEELQSKTGNSDLSNQEEKNKLSKEQKETTDDLKRLEKEMKELQEKMSEFDDLPNEEMQEMMEEMNQQNNPELSENAMQDIQQGMKQKVQQQQQQLSKNMKKMNSNMKQMQQMIMQQTQMQTFTEMMKILDNLLELSKQQEELKKNTEKLDPGSGTFNDKIQEQNTIQQNLSGIMQQMSELSQKTFAISPEMGKSMGDAQKEMNQSLRSLQNRNSGLASMNQGKAMMHLNEAATMMKNSMEAMMNGGSSGGMMSLMQQLNQLSGQQMNLNNLTQMLKQMQQGKLSLQQQAELQRLANEQSAIQKSLEQLNRESQISGESKKLPANLDQILKQMQEVVSDMKTEKLNDELVQKQERILSKLLDAQRSINERDFEKERESFTGQNVIRESPANLNLSTEEGKFRLKEEYNKAVQEGYFRDYENLIKRYYESLQKIQKN
ncbi:MAG: hypothetical protein HXY48_13160 [Ignavibacteriaceae bacterium]|nr:hypothetical protein [Ignavibacteriaceae bacterium]